MDEDTRLNIISSAEHAIGEIEGVLERPEDPDHIWRCLEAAYPRLSYIQQLLRDAGHESPTA